MPDVEAIWLCAMVLGHTAAEHNRLLRHMASLMQPGQWLGVRSTHQLRSLLYPALAYETFPDLELRESYHPTDDVVNSFILFQKV